MFGSIGVTEILLIAGIALIFLGPDRFPEFAKIVARTIKDIRGYVQEAQTEITKELKPVKAELDKISKHEPSEYLEKLAKLAEDDDDDEIIPEPDPTEFYNELEPEGELPGVPTPEGIVAYDAEPGSDANDEDDDDDPLQREREQELFDG